MEDLWWQDFLQHWLKMKDCQVHSSCAGSGMRAGRGWVFGIILQACGSWFGNCKGSVIASEGFEGVQTQFRHFPQPVADQLRN